MQRFKYARSEWCCKQPRVTDAACVQQVSVYDETAERITFIGSLRYHRGPILTISSTESMSKTMISSGTDGEIAIWDLSAMIDSVCAETAADQLRTIQLEFDSNQKPVFTAKVHQSGINSLQCVPLSSESSTLQRVLVVTGGDDQSVSATALRLERSTSEWQLEGIACIPLSHSSCVTGMSHSMSFWV